MFVGVGVGVGVGGLIQIVCVDESLKNKLFLSVWTMSVASVTGVRVMILMMWKLSLAPAASQIKVMSGVSGILSWV